MTRATLLFAHGGGFCKETWDPIIRRLRSSPMLQHAARATDFVTFDFKYHGTNRDESVTPIVDFSKSQSPRVHHPAQDLTRWTTADVLEQVRAIQQVQAKSSEPHALIGIGHSMGACALWNTEILHPGTFDGLILFEPVYGANIPGGNAVVDFLVALTLQREASWPSLADSVAHFEQLKNFERWDRESLASYIRGALVEEADGSVSLACHPHIEASLYCHKLLHFQEEQLPRAQCRVTFHSGSRTKMFYKPEFDGITAKWPDTYAVREPMANCTHALVLENPELAASNIARDLAELEVFKELFIEETDASVGLQARM